MTEPGPAEKPADGRRWRWLTLAEILGVAAVAISGLTLWNNYKERTGEEADKAAARAQASSAAQRLLLRGRTDREARVLTLSPATAGQTIQSQSVAFPTALGVPTVDTLSEPRIEAGWFERPLLRARGDGDETLGDARLPVLLTTRFYVGGEMNRDVAIYDLGYRIESGGLLGGHRVRLRGLSRVETVTPGRAQARLDAIWRERQGH